MAIYVMIQEIGLVSTIERFSISILHVHSTHRKDRHAPKAGRKSTTASGIVQ
jgi:hypothetical protein